MLYLKKYILLWLLLVQSQILLIYNQTINDKKATEKKWNHILWPFLSSLKIFFATNLKSGQVYFSLMDLIWLTCSHNFFFVTNYCQGQIWYLFVTNGHNSNCAISIFFVALWVFSVAISIFSAILNHLLHVWVYREP